MNHSLPTYLEQPAYQYRLDKARRASKQDVGLSEFKQKLWHGYVHAKHQEVLDDHLEQVAKYLTSGGEEGINRLIITMPPRYGKSVTTSQYFPAWMLGKMPKLRIIATSYGDRLAKRNSRKVRNIIKAEGYRKLFPATTLDKSKTAMDEWDTEQGGGMISAGVGGGITGHGGNLIIIDDPVKNRAEAESPTYRENIEDWYKADLYTRLETPGAIVLMMTRWHFEDLAGWLLADDVDNWTVVNLPAECPDYPEGEKPHYEWRKHGEPLWPEKHNEADLKKIRAAMGDYDYAALFGQDPQKSQGALFDTEKIEIIDVCPELVSAVRFYDLAVTEKSRSSYTAGVGMGVTRDEEFIVFDVYHVQKELPDVHEGIRQNAQIDGPAVHIRLEAEKAGIVELQHMLRDPRMRPYTMDAKPPEGDKVVRAGPYAARVNGGRVKLVRGKWNRAYLDELSVFPNGTFKDQVDGSSGAFKYLAEPKATGTTVRTKGLRNRPTMGGSSRRRGLH